MATMLTTPIVRERNNGLFLVEPAVEPTPRIPHKLRTLLAVEPLGYLDQDSARLFRAAHFSLRTVRAWHIAIEWVERGDPEVILLDLDAIDETLSSLDVSALRLVTLLKRAAGDRAITLAGITRRDFCEVEEIHHAGLHVFLPRALSPLRLVQRIDAAQNRQTSITCRAG